MKTIALFITLLVISSFAGFGQQNHSWDKWNWIMGTWIGEGTGQPGKGGGTFSFSFKLDHKIIERKGHTEFPAKDNKPATFHDDLLFVYLDYSGNPSKSIYFDSEGHTINYSISYADKSITLVSDKIPGVPVFRLTYTLLDDETVNTVFEMSQDGEKFMTYIEGKSKKEK